MAINLITPSTSLLFILKCFQMLFTILPKLSESLFLEQAIKAKATAVDSEFRNVLESFAIKEMLAHFTKSTHPHLIYFCK